MYYPDSKEYILHSALVLTHFGILDKPTSRKDPNSINKI